MFLSQKKITIPNDILKYKEIIFLINELITQHEDPLKILGCMFDEFVDMNDILYNINYMDFLLPMLIILKKYGREYITEKIKNIAKIIYENNNDIEYASLCLVALNYINDINRDGMFIFVNNILYNLEENVKKQIYKIDVIYEFILLKNFVEEEYEIINNLSYYF